MKDIAKEMFEPKFCKVCGEQLFNKIEREARKCFLCLEDEGVDFDEL